MVQEKNNPRFREKSGIVVYMFLMQAIKESRQ